MALFSKEKVDKTTKEKKEKKPQEPQYYYSNTKIPTYNYKVYYMSALEKILYFLLAFVAGALVGYLFYGGIGKDEFDQRTLLTWILDITIPCAVGIGAGIAFIPIRTQQIMEKKRNALRNQFRDMLEGLTTSLGAGRNMPDSFEAVYEDLQVQYEEDAAILQELYVILVGIRNNDKLEDLLVDFGARSGIEDIVSFANVFAISNRKGGNHKETIRNTYAILSDKMEINEDIETMVTANKTEQNMMIVMPIALIGMIKMMSADFAANFVTPAGILATTIGIVLFVAAYYVGRVVLDIKV